MKAAKLTTVLALILFGTLMAGSAMAATANLSVTATVSDACKITGGSLDFGSLDPLNATNVTKFSTGVTVTCTNGVVYSIADDKAGSYTMTNGANSIAYNLTYPALSAGDGTAQAITIQGDVLGTAYATKPAGTYNDTVQLTVTP